jgi:hypothetical protein
MVLKKIACGIVAFLAMFFGLVTLSGILWQPTIINGVIIDYFMPFELFFAISLVAGILVALIVE